LISDVKKLHVFLYDKNAEIDMAINQTIDYYLREINFLKNIHLIQKKFPENDKILDILRNI
jgi:hypothetical protein